MTHLNTNGIAMYSVSNGTVGSTYGYSVTTNPHVQTTYNGSNISSQFIGWDEQMKSLEKIGERIVKSSGNFPPYNVIKEDEDTFLVEFAVAGFSKKDIEVKQEKNA